jgi:hypothetical protein
MVFYLLHGGVVSVLLGPIIGLNEGTSDIVGSRLMLNVSVGRLTCVPKGHSFETARFALGRSL